MSHFEFNGALYSYYVQEPEEKLLERHAFAERMVGKAFRELGININDYHVDGALLNTAIIRINQRKLHYLMYHNGMKINELKQIAVFSYWVLRLKPIHRIAGGRENINEQVVMNWLFKANKLTSKKTKQAQNNF
ncbi:MAG: hypothetical protein FWC16_00975 [Defluviitaleaceae bacterium]|nr:hypothetical protein [Defluviitaleaceae bacterium]MCL2273477.1 hypothetical protein [Defluviitaleaceae bacterium]